MVNLLYINPFLNLTPKWFKKTIIRPLKNNISDKIKQIKSRSGINIPITPLLH